MGGNGNSRRMLAGSLRSFISMRLRRLPSCPGTGVEADPPRPASTFPPSPDPGTLPLVPGTRGPWLRRSEADVPTYHSTRQSTGGAELSGSVRRAPNRRFGNLIPLARVRFRVRRSGSPEDFTDFPQHGVQLRRSALNRHVPDVRFQSGHLVSQYRYPCLDCKQGCPASLVFGKAVRRVPGPRGP